MTFLGFFKEKTSCSLGPPDMWPVSAPWVHQQVLLVMANSTWSLHQHPLVMGPAAPCKFRSEIPVSQSSIIRVLFPSSAGSVLLPGDHWTWPMDWLLSLSCCNTTFSHDLDCWLSPVPYPGLSYSPQSGTVGLSPGWWGPCPACYVAMLDCLSFRQRLGLAAPQQPIPQPFLAPR